MEQKVFEKAKNYVLENSVEYSDGAIVSKVIAKNEAGTVTLFAFDKGQALSPHSAPFDALVQVIEGTANIIIDGNDNTLKAGEIIIMPAGISHAVDAIEKFKMLLTMLKA